jgi:hypothetical protein
VFKVRGILFLQLKRKLNVRYLVGKVNSVAITIADGTSASYGIRPSDFLKWIALICFVINAFNRTSCSIMVIEAFLLMAMAD